MIDWLYYKCWLVKEWLREKITDCLIWILRCINQSKSRVLAWKLHDIADQYDTRPSGQWRIEE